ncbi:SET domain-containing protein SmydA-8 [Scaptodrosophila lebanonensis]|uniref:SET domain-containing protein SmydA-8 n=1 Tax=Drosophila lebanonensis TaxID=7225 RepID=A0A6J2TKA5_DROLE|nr:SET domain-containing protein SmydA-8 [Scaptodrosophila lebanonensis]
MVRHWLHTLVDDTLMPKQLNLLKSSIDHGLRIGMLSHDCPVCGVAATRACTRCKMVRYCDGEHQKQHWPQHKKSCKPYREAVDEQLGRYLVATQDLKAKQIIFVEDPIVVGPKWYLSKTEKTSIIVPCVACYTPCRLGKHLCRRCRWPVCSANCVHESLECTVLSLGQGPAAKSDTRGLRNYYREDALLVLKCLLLQRQAPERWAALLQMQSHEEERKGTELHQEVEKRIVSYLHRNFLHRLNQVAKHCKERLISEYEPELIHRICGIIETNYMVIELATGVELSGLFRNACMMEHDCQPNCYFQFDNLTHQIAVHAGCDIKKGEHLKITYTNILWGTHMRQHHLGMTKHFNCRCARCLDPTEFGSYVSALRCLGDVNKTCTGIQLPIDPLNEHTQWKCDTCPMVVETAYVTGLQTHMSDDVEKLLAGRPTASQVELLLARLSQMLHPNHFHIFNLKHTLIQLYGYEVGLELASLSDAQLDRKLRLCDELYDICQRLDPHSIKLAIYVTVILIEMAHALEQQANRQSEQTQALVILEKARARLMEAHEVLEKEHDSVAGRKLYMKLQKEVFELDKLMVAQSHDRHTA